MKKKFLCAVSLALALITVLALVPASAAPAFVWGDATGDGTVDAKDLSLLRKYMAAYDYASGTSTVAIEQGADANGDGVIDSKDLSLLRKYMAAYDYTTGTSTVALGPTIPEPPAPLPDGKLIYAENFESYKTTSSTALADLGWVADTTSNGAYKNNTTKYSFKDFGGSRQLYLDNNRTDCSDSYAIVLTNEQMGVLHSQNYSYQYDLNYADSSDAKRYIVLCSEYNGAYYNSFHLRNNGSANNQAHWNDSWYTYDVSGVYYAANTNSFSIATKLLGVTFSETKNALKGISVSVRYTVDWTNGNTVAIRVNTPGYPGSGKWTVVSKASKSAAGASAWGPDKGGAAIVLKTGGKQNGYVDNILVWTGTGEAPTDLSSPLLNAHKDGCTGHVYVGSGTTCSDPIVCKYCGEVLPGGAGHHFVEYDYTNDRHCTVCGAIESNLDSDWLLEEVPSFIGGTYSKAVYLCGQAMDDSALPREKESEMMLVSGVSAAAYNQYLFRLFNYDFEQYYSFSRDGNRYAGYTNGSTNIYAYYLAAESCVRVILDRSSNVTPEEFGYTYTKVAGDTTVLYQYGVPMNEFAYGYSNSLNTDGKIDCGMVYVIKLADNSVVFIDGGGYQQFDDAECAGFMKFLREITGVPAGQKIRVAGWYFTHAHSDHVSGLALFIKKYGKANLTLERVFNNFPSVYSENTTLAACRGTVSKSIKYLDQYLTTDVKYLKLHTGENFQLADVKFSVIFTHEDIVDKTTATSGIGTDFNNSNTVLKIEFDGKTFMLLGDINKPDQTIILNNNSDATLKADIVQMAHHVFNDVSSLYKKIQAPVVLVPQAKGGEISGRHNKNAMTAAKTYLKNNMIFYADQGTYGVGVVNGEVKLVYEKKGVDGGSYTGWSW